MTLESHRHELNRLISGCTSGWPGTLLIAACVVQWLGGEGRVSVRVDCIPNKWEYRDRSGSMHERSSIGRLFAAVVAIVDTEEAHRRFLLLTHAIGDLLEADDDEAAAAIDDWAAAAAPPAPGIEEVERLGRELERLGAR